MFLSAFLKCPSWLPCDLGIWPVGREVSFLLDQLIVTRQRSLRSNVRHWGHFSLLELPRRASRCQIWRLRQMWLVRLNLQRVRRMSPLPWDSTVELVLMMFWLVCQIPRLRSRDPVAVVILIHLSSFFEMDLLSLRTTPRDALSASRRLWNTL